MITGQLRSRIDKLWEEFWTGGITNPLTVIEQISFLMFSRLLDMRESTEEKRWNRTNKGKAFPGVFFIPGEEGQKIRWSNFRHLGGESMLPLVRDKVFPHFRTLGTNGHQSKDEPKNTFAEYMKDAQLMIQKPSLLVSAVNMIEELPLAQGDTKGDLYEYLLGKLTTAGINGQFRTPRHIIDLMVDLMEPEPTWVIGDPACGTGGFLVSVMEHLRKKYTSKEGRIVEKSNGEQHVTYTGDLLEPYRQHIQSGMFHGFDFDVTMLRIAAMNLMLHGVDTPDIHYQDTLSNNFPDRFPNYSSECFDLILANPPFKGSLDEQDVHSSLTGKVKTKKTELLFLILMLRMLKLGGRCAVIVPDGVLFGSSNAHVAARKLLVEEHQLEAVVKLPAGVFKPYAGVSTAILIFTKGGRTTDVWFYDVQADGYSLDDKRDPVEANDLPDVCARWAKRNPKKDTDRKDKAFFVPKAEIAENKYDLSLNRYKEIVHEEVKYDPPKKILARLKKLEAEIARDLNGLEAMLDS
jgi:type I restriction enzyme M protein